MLNKLIAKVLLALGSCVAMSAPVFSAVTLEIDDTKWLSVGMGARAGFSSVENSAANGDRSKDFDLHSARLYFNGQLHDKIKCELNTECVFCSGGSSEYQILDAIVKFEFSPEFNVWAGRMLVPADRAEMSGPYYANTYDFNKTPFYPADFSVDFGVNGAGVYGRDHGINVWGALGQEGRFQYVAGIYNGLESSVGSGANSGDDFLYAARLAYNFLNVEKNPGYYTSSTYYGEAGDIFTVAFAVQSQKNGVGTVTNPGDFTGMSVDLLFEKILSNNSVVTVEAEYKSFDSDFDVAAYTDGEACFCMFDGDAWTATVLHLFPNEVGMGKLQPYVRYTDTSPDASADRDELELGMNYIISGHNARISVSYQKGDIATKGLNFAPTAAGPEVNAFKVSFQVQL